jgi:hypothetical protein
MERFSWIIFFLAVSSAFDTIPQKKKPGDICDGRVERWCDFDGGVWCRGGKCQCLSSNMEYNPETEACVSKVWFSCGNFTTGDVLLPTINCVDNAICQQTISGRECRCKMGFIEDEEGFCVQKL